MAGSPAKNIVVEEEEAETSVGPSRPLAEVSASERHPGETVDNAGVRRSVRLTLKARVDYRLSGPWYREQKYLDSNLIPSFLSTSTAGRVAARWRHLCTSV